MDPDEKFLGWSCAGRFYHVVIRTRDRTRRTACGVRLDPHAVPSKTKDGAGCAKCVAWAKKNGVGLGSGPATGYCSVCKQAVDLTIGKKTALHQTAERNDWCAGSVMEPAPTCATCGGPCDTSDPHAGIVCRNKGCAKAQEDGTCES